LVLVESWVGGGLCDIREYDAVVSRDEEDGALIEELKVVDVGFLKWPNAGYVNQENGRGAHEQG